MKSSESSSSTNKESISKVLPFSSLPLTSTFGSSSNLFTHPVWFFYIAMLIGVFFQELAAFKSAPTLSNSSIISNHP